MGSRSGRRGGYYSHNCRKQEWVRLVMPAQVPPIRSTSPCRGPTRNPTLTWTGGRWCAQRARHPAVSAPAPPRCHILPAPPGSGSSLAWSPGPGRRDGHQKDTAHEAGVLQQPRPTPTTVILARSPLKASGPDISSERPK
jgi:hypothetical protein